MDNDTVVVGDWVVAGYGEDADVGKILSLHGDDVAVVAWESGVRTTCELSGDDVEVFGDRASCESSLSARRGVCAEVGT